MNRTKRIEIRVDPFEYKIIKSKARDCGISISEFIRISALGKSTPKQMDISELKVYSELKQFYNYFRSISNLFKKGDQTKMIQEIQKTQHEIREHLHKIRTGKYGQ